MLHALIKGKYRSSRSESCEPMAYQDLEDHLTAAVLSRLCYLQYGTAEEIVERSIIQQVVTTGAIVATEHSENNDLSVEFWPRYKDVTNRQSTVEPDAILRIGRHVYIVEAKRYDTRAQRSEQPFKEWLAWGSDADVASVNHPGDIHTILLLGGIASRANFAVIAEEIGRLLSDATTEIAYRPNLAWISWESLAHTIRRKILDVSAPEARILQDIDLALTFHGYGTWLTLDSVDKSWTQHRSAADLPIAIEWPNAPMVAATRHATKPAPIQFWALTAHDLCLVNSQRQTPVAWPHSQEVSR